MTYLAQTIDSLLVAHSERLQVVLSQGHHETRHGKSDALSVVSGQQANRHPGVSTTHQVLIVHDGDDAKSPLGRRDDLGMLAVEAEQRKGSLLLYERARGSVNRKSAKLVSALRSATHGLMSNR